MPIGSAQRDSRRRRVLLDDKQEDAAAKKSNRKKKSGADTDSVPEKLYTEAALVDHHLPISSMVPKKFWMLAMIALGLVGLVVGLNFLDGASQRWSEQYGAQQVMAFDMIAGQGIVKWLSSFLLAVASLYCVQVYLIRRHRNDDYRGSYRLWGWLAAFFLLLSLNATAGVSELFLNLVRDFARAKTGFNNPVVWTAVILLPITICLLRVLVEIRESKGAIAALLLACGAFLLAMLLDNNLLKLDFAPNANSRIVHCNLILIGYISLFLSSAVYSRFVYMDSQGFLTGKAMKRSERATVRSEKRQEREQAKAAKREARQLEQEQKREQATALAAERKQQAEADKAARQQKKAATAAERKQKTETSGTARSKAKTERNAAKTKQQTKEQPKAKRKERPAGPLSNRTARRTQGKAGKASDPDRTIPDFKEITDEQSRPSTFSIEEMQRKLSASKNRSERKRLKKMIEAQQRQQKRAA